MRYVGYGAMHSRVRKSKGAASLHICLHCGRQAQEWAYDHNDPDCKSESAFGKFSLKLEHYIPLCCKCHRKMDRNLHKLGPKVDIRPG